MTMDLIFLLIFMVLTVYGYFKGFFISILNFIFLVVYIIVATKVIGFSFDNIMKQALSGKIEPGYFDKYIIILVLGVILYFVMNIIIRRIIRKSKLSGADKVIGGGIYFLIAYFLVATTVVIMTFISQFISMDHLIGNSFFFSDFSKGFNFYYWWWLSV